MASVEADRRSFSDADVAADWSDGHRYSPAPRHRRRLLLKWLEALEFDDVLDAGCAQPFLLQDIVNRFHVPAFGCDLSPVVVAENQRVLPDCEFRVLDLAQERWPEDRQFDLVVCSEVLEHIDDWEAALANVVRMARKHVLITVPGGPLRAMDRIVGHHRHYQGPELTVALEVLGCEVTPIRSWGWPMHSAYKASLSLFSPESLYQSFSGGARYGPVKRAVSEALYRAFFANDLVGRGHQLLVHATAPAHLPDRDAARVATLGASS
jgi:Methyltransferase domain